MSDELLHDEATVDHVGLGAGLAVAARVRQEGNSEEAVHH